MRRIAILCSLMIMILSGCKIHKQVEEDTRIHFGNACIKAHYKARIDSLINDAIQREAMPGCRIMAVLNRDVIFDQCYGYLDYDSIQQVTDSTYYDMASVTKLAASSLALMAMYDDQLLDLDKPLPEYIPGLMDNGATLRDALAHQAGFKAWIPLRTKLPELSAQLLDTSRVYNSLAARKAIISYITEQPLNDKGEYLYSDLGFYVYPQLVRKYYNREFESFLYTRFYKPLEIRPVFNPTRYMPASQIPPTENDSIWRHTIVRGTVHDEGAALMGGLSGHAGLFARARDMAVIMQMLLNKGEYGGIRFLRPGTVELFTSQAFPGNRRGLVFDKPVLDTALNGTPSKMASMQSFGHTGFTGTFVWADPRNNLILIFLCNSTYPQRSSMISKLNVRTQLHDIFYNSDILE